MAAIKVLIADKLSEDGVAILRGAPELSVDVKTGLTPPQLAELIGPYEGLIVRSATKVTAEVIAKAERLRVIGRAGVGVDNVDAQAATKRGIIVMNVPAGNTISTAEHTISMLLALARRIPQAYSSLRGGQWERNKFVGTEVFGKTLGIIGLGKIGLEVARRAQAMGMRVLAHDPFLSSERTQQLDVQMAELARVYAEADFITVHTPLTAETKHMIGREALTRMKRGVRLINCARGGIIDEQALAEAVTSGHVGGAAVDVYEQEPPPTDHPLLSLEQVICTPHLGASTQEAQQNVAVEVAKQVLDALLGRGIRNAVNMPSVDGQTLLVLQPYIVLGEKLGSLATQLFGGQTAEVRVTYVGDITKHDTSPVTLAVLKGLLAPVVGENVNYVNASVIAAERGVKVIEAKASQMDEFATLLALDVRVDGKAHALQGTLSARREPRIVKIGPYFVEAVPDGHMLIIHNQDRPGLIGNLGTLLGKAGINIAAMSNGRDAPGGTAITVVNIDQPIPDDVLARVGELAHVVDAKLIRL
ncbi:MAG TPA: phosphoglycerate dehydrogenase [bacterium]